MANNDNAMARFLFAILQQKCLKDIDWNKVARDPVLTQPITNGHAARMRYSRFKAAMLGHEPQRRNRTNPDKSRVSKKNLKKTNIRKLKTEESSRDNGNGSDNIKAEAASDANPVIAIKTEQRGATPSSQPPVPMMPTAATVKTEPELAHCTQRGQQPLQAMQPFLSAALPKIKQEQQSATNTTANAIQTPPMAEPLPFGLPITTSAMASNTAYTDMAARAQMRLLTPSSDSDMTQGFIPHSPAGYHHSHNTVAPATSTLTATSISPSPSASASMSPSSPFDFSPCTQTHDYYDTPAASWQPHFSPTGTVTTPQKHHLHDHDGHGHHHHGQSPSLASLYSIGFAAPGCGYTGTGINDGYTAGATYSGELQHSHHHHHHHLLQQQQHKDQEPGHATAVSLFREREMELQTDTTAVQAVKQEPSGWDTQGYAEI
ncbi:hypothetical protein VTK26DRAFT_7533 [Humicola hyalothermophila]